MFEKEDVFKLVKSINDAHGDAKQDEKRLRTIFDKFWWGDLEKTINGLTPHATKGEKKRSTEEMLYQLIETTTQIARNMPDAEAGYREARLADEVRMRQMEVLKLMEAIKELKDNLLQVSSEYNRLVTGSTPPTSTLDASLPKSFSNLAEGSLRKAHIRTFRQLASKTPSELEKLGFAPIVIKALIQHLALFDLTLAPEPPVSS